MSFALVYWILMLLWFVFGMWSNYPFSGANARPAGSTALLFLLLLILGWATFGTPVHK